MDKVTKDPQIISGVVEEVVGTGETFTLLKLFPETYLTLEHREDDFSQCPPPNRDRSRCGSKGFL